MSHYFSVNTNSVAVAVIGNSWSFLKERFWVVIHKAHPCFPPLLPAVLACEKQRGDAAGVFGF